MMKLMRSKGIVTVLICAFLLTGCGNKLDKSGGYSVETAAGTKVLAVGEEKICLDEILVYVFFDLYQNGYTTDNIEASSNTCREAVLATIRENYIVYKNAVDAGYSITEDDSKKIDEYTANFCTTFEKVMDKYGIREEVVKRVYSMQAVIEKFENDEYNTLSEGAQNAITDKYKDTKFFTAFMFQVPTIQVDDNNNPKVDESGEYISVADSEKTALQETATKVREEAIGIGADPDKLVSLAEKYQISSYSSQTMGYIGMYNDKYNKIFDSMSNGDVTDVDELDKGYVFYVMIDNSSMDAKDNYLKVLKEQYIKDTYSEMQQEWLDKVTIDNEKDILGTDFAELNLKQMVKDMKDAGIVSAK